MYLYELYLIIGSGSECNKINEKKFIVEKAGDFVITLAPPARKIKQMDINKVVISNGGKIYKAIFTDYTQKDHFRQEIAEKAFLYIHTQIKILKKSSDEMIKEMIKSS